MSTQKGERKVLLSCVGTHDPESRKGPAAIVTAVRHLKPDEVWLFPTTDRGEVRYPTEDNARQTREYIENLHLSDPPEEIHIEILNVDNPTDFDQIRGAIREKLELVESRLGDRDYHLDVNISSGTAQMEATWLTMAEVGLLQGTLWMVSVPEEDKTETPEERVQKVSAVFLSEDSIITRTIELLRNYNFGAAKREMEKLEDVSNDPATTYTAHELAKLFGAYLNWDMLNIEEARRELGQISSKHERTKGYKELVKLTEDQTNTLRRYFGERNERGELLANKTNLLDLYHNARRREEEGNYADCVNRICNFIEAVMSYRLRRQGIDPDRLGNSEEADKADKVRNKYDFDNRGKLNFRASLNALTDKKLDIDTPFRNFASSGVPQETQSHWEGKEKELNMSKMKRLIRDIRDKRNASIAGHGFEPVSEELAQVSLQVAKEILLRVLFLDEDKIKSYCFSRERVLHTLTDFLENLRR